MIARVDVAHALLRAVSTLMSTRLGVAHSCVEIPLDDAFLQRKRVDMSVDTARKSACATNL